MRPPWLLGHLLGVVVLAKSEQGGGQSGENGTGEEEDQDGFPGSLSRKIVGVSEGWDVAQQRSDVAIDGEVVDVGRDLPGGGFPIERARFPNESFDDCTFCGLRCPVLCSYMS